MARLKIELDGTVRLPGELLRHYGLSPGTEVVVESQEDGWAFHVVRPDLRKVYVEVTALCNLSCPICIRQVWRDRPGSMPWELFEELIHQLRAFPELRRVIFGGFGEPLVHPRIADMVALARTLGAGATLTTNGLLLDRGMARELLGAGLDTIVVSIDAAHLQAYRQAGLADGLDRVLDNIRGLRALARERGGLVPRIGLEFVLTRDSLSNLQDVPRLAQALGASFALITHLLPHTPDQAQAILYDHEEPAPTLSGWPVLGADWLIWGMARMPRFRWGAWRRCRFVEERATVIRWDGGVSPCYALMHSYPYYIYGRRKEVTAYILGFIQDRSLVEIWGSEEYVRFRAKVRAFRFPSCVDCGMACDYAAHNEDCWGNSPSCADCLWAQDIVRCP
ncbi:tungsten cofactor oxidoreductase radical SAM maturase [Thermoflexus sp.]|uniref:tungsten cofactor oxidoreductase radical SAM maturase n=1 Tax=Thermoflexus sp. TaxID=1969742 RepID=UPI002ADE3CB3|nr:tungsten cofactor oxidoreductase radical SAM maturase [Thermoflexus sp.]